MKFKLGGSCSSYSIIKVCKDGGYMRWRHAFDTIEEAFEAKKDCMELEPDNVFYVIKSIDVILG